MTDEQMAAWLREEAKLAVYLSEEEMINAIADRIEALQAEVERLKDQLSVETEPSPYCPICGSCGDEGCCGSKRCMYPDTGIEALQAENAKLREEIIASLNQRIEDVRACNAQPLVARFMAIDEIDWLEETKAALQETER